MAMTSHEASCPGTSQIPACLGAENRQDWVSSAQFGFMLL